MNKRQTPGEEGGAPAGREKRDRAAKKRRYEVTKIKKDNACLWFAMKDQLKRKGLSKEPCVKGKDTDEILIGLKTLVLWKLEDMIRNHDIELETILADEDELHQGTNLNIKIFTSQQN